jgi:predicted HTH domain antitoxin
MCAAKELKEILKARAIDFSDCYEKSDLVNKIKAIPK